MREIITRWTTAGSPGGLSVMYFDEEGFTVAEQRAALNTLWSAVDANLTTSTTWRVDSVGRTLDANTGVLTGDWAEATAYTAAGALSGSAVPNASMLLLRWATGFVINGRAVKGRTYVPGLGAGLLVDGQVAAASSAAISGFAQAFVADGNGFGVWHRPSNGSGGDLVTASSGSSWNELAVQRGRRA